MGRLAPARAASRPGLCATLSRFTPDEEKALAPALERAAEAARELIANGVPAAAAKYNGKG